MSGAYVINFGTRMKEYPKTSPRTPVHSGWWRVRAKKAWGRVQYGPWIYFEARCKTVADSKGRAMVGSYRVLELVMGTPEVIPAGGAIGLAGGFIEAKL
jgi:hypothetical protein